MQLDEASRFVGGLASIRRPDKVFPLYFNIFFFLSEIDGMKKETRQCVLTAT